MKQLRHICFFLMIPGLLCSCGDGNTDAGKGSAEIERLASITADFYLAKSSVAGIGGKAQDSIQYELKEDILARHHLSQDEFVKLRERVLGNPDNTKLLFKKTKQIIDSLKRDVNAEE